MGGRLKILLDDKWKFHRGDISVQGIPWGLMKSGIWNQGGQRTLMDDMDWREVDLPHDFVIEESYRKSDGIWNDGSNKGETSVIPEMFDLPDLHTMKGSLDGGVAWYRKTFFVPGSERNKIFYVEFEGVFRNCQVYLNDFYIGSHRSGYTGFFFDLTDVINYGGNNVLAVRVDASEAEGWFYEGGGIYRHVWLIKTDVVHIEPWGVFVSTDVLTDTLKSASVTADAPTADVKVQTTLTNRFYKDYKIKLISFIYDKYGHEVSKDALDIDIAAWSTREIRQKLKICNATLWSVDTPVLYDLVSHIIINGRVVDNVKTSFGIRSICFDSEKGFLLNGTPLKIKGVCCHQDHAGTGIAIPDFLYEYRLMKLKEMGCNGYRCAHHPVSPKLLDICDRLGILVMCENRLLSSAQEDMQQLSDMIYRDRNHPCIIMWSIGNEEARIQCSDEGARIALHLKQLVRKLDSTRMVTLAICIWNHYTKKHNELYEVLKVSRHLDVMGFNYALEKAREYHDIMPGQPLIVSEASTFPSTRCCYENSADKCHISMTDPNAHKYMFGEKEWNIVAESQYLSGIFIWTGFDYRGETSPSGWPAISSHFGVMDTCGFPKDSYYYYKSWWSRVTVLHLFPHWNWSGHEGEPINIWCFSNCNEVELFVNGINYGCKIMEKNMHLVWENVPYSPGELLAKGYINGKCVIEKRIGTTGAPFAVILDPDRNVINADNKDISVITVKVVDCENRVVPESDNDISFNVEGCGKILGTGNGDPKSHENDKGNKRHAFHGLCQLIIQATYEYGDIYITASSPGLQKYTAVIKALKTQ